MESIIDIAFYYFQHVFFCKMQYEFAYVRNELSVQEPSGSWHASCLYK